MNVQQFGNHNGENEFAGSDFINLHDQSKITLTPRDRLVMSWENTMDLARNFKRYAMIDETLPNGAVFKELAELQGVCAAKLHDLLGHYEVQEDN